MNVKNAVGGFFTKAWRWIKETAWIQPLLIVGIIFGVIFSIPPIVKKAKEIKAREASKASFFANYQISLKDDKANNFTKSLESLTYLKQDNPDASFDELIDMAKKDDSDFALTKDDDKFFFVYVSEDCSACEAAYTAFKTLKDKLGSDSYPLSEQNKGQKFKMRTIFVDEGKDKDVFDDYMDNNMHFFELLAESATDYDYSIRTDSDSRKLFDEGITIFNDADKTVYAPTIILMDFTENAPTDNGIAEVLFGIPKAESGRDKNKNNIDTLLDCWNNEGLFADE